MTSKKNQIKYLFKDILTIQFSVKEHPYDVDDLFKNLKITYGSSFSANIEDEALLFDLEIVATSELDDVIECFSMELRNVFLIEDLASFLKPQGNLSIPKEHLTLFASLGYSTARGILHEKLAFSRYRPKFILPVIDPNKITDNIDFEDIQIFDNKEKEKHNNANQADG
ncbi:MAG: hypothetical protein JJU13_08405 [Balneolaceae bacterium]|nr:hypothetical protein [Balneolaceae bacterium]